MSAAPLYGCQSLQLSISNNSTTLESVQGNHLSGKSNTDVEFLLVQNDPIDNEELPRNIHTFFPNLLLIRWVSGNLKTVSADDLLPFPNLTGFSVWINKIESIEGNLFEHTPKLKWIDFQSNRITNVGPGIFDNLDQLRTIYFVQNYCIDQNAFTLQEIEELKQKLTIQCPQASTTQTSTSSTTEAISTSTITIGTTTEGTCSVRCTVNDEIDSLMESFAEQTRFNDEQSKTNEKLQEINQETISRICELEDLVAKGDERILELERQMREVLAKP